MSEGVASRYSSAEDVVRVLTAYTETDAGAMLKGTHDSFSVGKKVM